MAQKRTSRLKGRPDRAHNRARREAEVRRRQRMRLGWAAVGLVALGLVAAALVSVLSGTATAAPDIDGVQCNTTMQLAYHIHAHLTIYDAGRPVTVPEGVGINQRGACYYWLHTHDTSGVIHVESPVEQQYPLRNFLDIWGQAVNKTSFLSHRITAGHTVRAYVGGGSLPAIRGVSCSRRIL